MQDDCRSIEALRGVNSLVIALKEDFSETVEQTMWLSPI
jgi:hypothetical protein